MIVKKGEDRIAFVGEKLTFKLAKTSPRRAGERMKHIFKKQGLRGLLNEWVRYGADDHHTLPNHLLHGVVANRRERRLAREFGEVVVPTISILGGIANMQRTAEPTELSHREIHRSFAENLGTLVVGLGHMLENTTNLGVNDGRVKFVDGGSRRLEGLMQSNAPEVEMSLVSIGEAVSN